METPRRRRTDAATKLLFVRDVIADLVCIALPAFAEELELDATEPLPTEFIDAEDRSRRLGDAACRIPFAWTSDEAERRHALVSVDFQEPNDPGPSGGSHQSIRQAGRVDQSSATSPAGFT